MHTKPFISTSCMHYSITVPHFYSSLIYFILFIAGLLLVFYIYKRISDISSYDLAVRRHVFVIFFFFELIISPSQAIGAFWLGWHFKDLLNVFLNLSAIYEDTYLFKIDNKNEIPVMYIHNLQIKLFQ